MSIQYCFSIKPRRPGRPYIVAGRTGLILRVVDVGMLNLVKRTQHLTSKAFKQLSTSRSKYISEWSKEDVQRLVVGSGLSTEVVQSLKEFDGRTLRLLTVDMLQTNLCFKFEHALSVVALIEAEKEKEERALKKKEEQEERALKKKEEEESKDKF